MEQTSRRGRDDLYFPTGGLALTDSDLSDDEFERLLSLDVDELQRRLALRSLFTGSEDPTLLDEPESGYSELLPTDRLRTLGRELFAAWSKIAWEYVCGSKSDVSRDGIAKAFEGGKGATIAAALTASLDRHIGGAEAALVAAIVVKLFFTPGYEATCAVWRAHLEP